MEDEDKKEERTIVLPESPEPPWLTYDPLKEIRGEGKAEVSDRPPVEEKGKAEGKKGLPQNGQEGVEDQPKEEPQQPQPSQEGVEDQPDEEPQQPQPSQEGVEDQPEEVQPAGQPPQVSPPRTEESREGSRVAQRPKRGKRRVKRTSKK